MAKVKMSTPLPVSADQVWKLIGGFHALPDWHPAVQKSELADGGRVRRLQLLGGASLVERMESFDDNDHVYTYTIEKGALPVANYKSTVRVRNEEGKEGCVVEWSGDFVPAGVPENDAVATMQGIYQAGLDNLRKLFNV